MPAFADSHVHLADAAFAGDVDAVVDRAGASGALALVCIGETPEVARRAQGLAERHPGRVYHTCGRHPHEAAHWDSVRDPEAIREAVEAGAVAVGECGLDYHYDHAPRDRQRQVLAAQLELAAALGRPVVLHTRDAEEDTRSALRDAMAAGVRGVLHCFTGSTGLAMAGLDAGWYVSFSGIITFRSWTDEALLRLVPADRLLVESDAPYLAPVPYRGKRNESAWVALTLARLAAVRGIAIDQVAAETLHNCCTLFGLRLRSPQPSVYASHAD